jgi:hypothetical protein
MDINIQHQFAPQIYNQKLQRNTDIVGRIDGTSGTSAETGEDGGKAVRTRNHRPRELEMVYKKLYQTESRRRTSGNRVH